VILAALHSEAEADGPDAEIDVFEVEQPYRYTYEHDEYDHQGSDRERCLDRDAAGLIT
jgi:hypothetical protein